MIQQILHIGIATVAEQRKRSLAIAAGQGVRKVNEPKIWFSSLRALAQVLSDENMALLRILRDEMPETIQQLAQRLDRAPSNVSRSLSTLANYGLVELHKQGRTVQAKATAYEYRIAVY